MRSGLLGGELIINSTGLSAPKKVEQTNKTEDITPEEAKKRLMEMMNNEGNS